MKAAGARVGIALGLTVFQTTACGSDGLCGVHPDLLLLFVLMIGMRRGETAGALWGVGLGMLQDGFSAGLPGVGVLTKGLLGFAAGSLREQLDCENPNTQAIIAAAATLVDGLAHLTLLKVFSSEAAFLTPFFGMVAPAAALHGALLPLSSAALRSARRWRQRRLAAAGA